ncbi:MAG: hypothetical protein VB934_20465 [Polyangiaceae bacterium]
MTRCDRDAEADAARNFERDADSPWVLSALALGMSGNAVLGLSSYTMQVYGRGPQLAATAVTHSALDQLALVRAGLVELLPPAHRGVYGCVLAGTGILVISAATLPSTLTLLLPLTLATTAVVLLTTRRAIDVAGTISELARLPLLRRLARSDVP